MTTKSIANNIFKNLEYLYPAIYYSRSGSAYIFLPIGVVRVSNHDTAKPVKYKVFPRVKIAEGYRCYGNRQIGLLINEIKEEMKFQRFAGCKD